MLSLDFVSSGCHNTLPNSVFCSPISAIPCQMPKSLTVIAVPISPVYFYGIWVALYKHYPLIGAYYYCIHSFHSFYWDWFCLSLLWRCFLPPWPNLRLGHLLPLYFSIVHPWSWCPVVFLLSQPLFFPPTFPSIPVQSNHTIILLLN